MVGETCYGDIGFSFPALRRDYQADLVCVITELENQGIAGVDNDTPPATGNP